MKGENNKVEENDKIENKKLEKEQELPDNLKMVLARLERCLQSNLGNRLTEETATGIFTFVQQTATQSVASKKEA